MRKIEFKPWGWYLTLEENGDFKVKKIYVKPGHQFSLQYHNDREEHWTIIQGIGTITQGEIESTIRPGEYAYIPKEQIHRLNGGENGITFIEVQRGVCSEDDIVRLKDDYGRI
jgi:mannose-1-phosphate guanylyltransferase/mannose-6-phosphate isomerase